MAREEIANFSICHLFVSTLFKSSTLIYEDNSRFCQYVFKVLQILCMWESVKRYIDTIIHWQENHLQSLLVTILCWETKCLKWSASRKFGSYWLTVYSVGSLSYNKWGAAILIRGVCLFLFVCMVFNAAFNNCLVISRRFLSYNMWVLRWLFLFVCMVFNAAFNNCSDISRRFLGHLPVLLVLLSWHKRV